MSESAGCHTVVTSLRLHSIENGPEVRSCEPPACFKNPKGWIKSCSIRRKKTVIGWILQQSLGCIVLGSPERKMWILPPRFGIQVDTPDVYPQDPRMLQIYLGLLDLSYRGNVMEQTFERYFDSPCECGTRPYDHGLWGYCHWKMNK